MNGMDGINGIRNMGYAAENLAGRKEVPAAVPKQDTMEDRREVDSDGWRGEEEQGVVDGGVENSFPVSPFIQGRACLIVLQPKRTAFLL